MIPPSRFECPRCGFGIRPGDAQCGRCGEDIIPKPPKPIQAGFSTVRLNKDKMEETSTVRIRSVENIMVARPDSNLQFRMHDLERRERALQEKERKLTALAEGLEERAQVVEAVIPVGPTVPGSTEMDEMRQKFREDLLRQFEPELEALQSQLDEKEAELQQARLKVNMLESGETLAPAIDQQELERLTEEILQELRGQLEYVPAVIDPGVLRTHITKLDEVLGGGIPHGHTILITGSPGTMKSTLTYTILHRAAAVDGLSGLYLSLEQSKRSILRQMEKMGMPLEAAEGKLKVADLRDLRQDMAEQPGNWREVLLHYVKKEQRETGFKVFVLDSLESFKAMAEQSFSRQELKDLFDWFKSLGITVLVISENVTDDYDEANQGEAYLSDGIMELMMRELNDSRVQRWVRCVKMRGMKTDARYYSLFHDGKGFNLSLPLANQPF